MFKVISNTLKYSRIACSSSSAGAATFGWLLSGAGGESEDRRGGCGGSSTCPRDCQSSWWCYKTGISPSLLVLALPPPLSPGHSYLLGRKGRTGPSARPTVVRSCGGCCYRCPLCRRLAADSLLLQDWWWCVRGGLVRARAADQSTNCGIREPISTPSFLSRMRSIFLRMMMSAKR